MCIWKLFNWAQWYGKILFFAFQNIPKVGCGLWNHLMKKLSNRGWSKVCSGSPLLITKTNMIFSLLLCCWMLILSASDGILTQYLTCFMWWKGWTQHEYCKANTRWIIIFFIVFSICQSLKFRPLFCSSHLKSKVVGQSFFTLHTRNFSHQHFIRKHPKSGFTGHYWSLVFSKDTMKNVRRLNLNRKCFS